ncbi:MAG: hypothetical protein ACXVDJ_03765 [Tumebacillaceae bacterium]
MWESLVMGFMGATVWDWVWHIIAIALAVYITVPGLWWPHVEKYMKKKREKEEQARLHAEHLKNNR